MQLLEEAVELGDLQLRRLEVVVCELPQDAHGPPPAMGPTRPRRPRPVSRAAAGGGAPGWVARPLPPPPPSMGASISKGSSPPPAADRSRSKGEGVLEADHAASARLHDAERVPRVRVDGLPHAVAALAEVVVLAHGALVARPPQGRHLTPVADHLVVCGAAGLRGEMGVGIENGREEEEWNDGGTLSFSSLSLVSRRMEGRRHALSLSLFSLSSHQHQKRKEDLDNIALQLRERIKKNSSSGTSRSCGMVGGRARRQLGNLRHLH